MVAGNHDDRTVSFVRQGGEAFIKKLFSQCRRIHCVKCVSGHDNGVDLFIFYDPCELFKKVRLFFQAASPFKRFS
ncbi:hypothetical protein BJQ92_01569 [Bacillus licheniformis]|nr:hypothetical protein [Bacillus licheniformis]